MPYISQEKRLLVEKFGPAEAGELNYLITKLIVDYWATNGPSYQCINNIVGALEGAKAEFQRRIVEPYEDKKRADNGDVYS